MQKGFYKLQKTYKTQSPFAIGSPALIWQFFFFYLPLLLMMLTSIFKITEEETLSGITMQHFLLLFSKSHFSIILNSLLLSFLTAFICLFTAFPLAYFIAFQGKKYKNLLLFFLILPFWSNFLLHVYAWFFVLEREGFLNNLLLSFGMIHQPIHFLNSLFAVMLMMVYCYLPFMVLPIFSSLERFDRHLLEASNDLGGSHIKTFLNIMLPLTLPAVRTGFFLVFIPSFGEFIIPELMGGDKYYFVGNAISEYVMGDNTGGIGAAFMVLSCISLISVAALIYILFKKVSQKLIRGAL